MEQPPIHTEQEYDAALQAIEALWTAPAGAAEAAQLESLVTRVEAYEALHSPIAPPEPLAGVREPTGQAAARARASRAIS